MRGEDTRGGIGEVVKNRLILEAIAKVLYKHVSFCKEAPLLMMSQHTRNKHMKQMRIC